MSARTTVCTLALVVLASGATPVAAGEGSVGVDAEVVSQYVWRGVVLDDGWSLQPDLVFGYEFNDSNSVELAAWWNAALESHGSSTHRDEVFEQDLTLTFAHQFSESIGLEAGSIYYWNPFSDLEPGSDSWHTTELFLGGGWSAEPVSVDGTLSYDLEAVKGWYLDLAGSVSLPLSATVAVEPSLHLGFAVDESPNPTDPDEEYWYEENGLVDGGAAVGLTYTSDRGLSVGGAVHYAHRFDGVSEDQDVVWLSVKVGYWP
jgi:hypothetical protein